MPDKFSERTKAAKPDPLMWPSIWRLAATASIFFYHFNSMYGFPSRGLDIFGIGSFCFISGFFAWAASRGTAESWLLKRVSHVMIPYWLVIIPILIANHFIHYKPSTLYHDFLIAFGGAMFLSNPVYVLSWFITLILIFYALAYLYKKKLPVPISALISAAALTFLYTYSGWRHALYFAAFVGGYFLARYGSRFGRGSKSPRSENYQRWNRYLYDLQAYTYYFFLVHGAFLVLYIYLLELPWPVSLGASVVTVTPSAVALKIADGRIQRFVFKRHRT